MTELDAVTALMRFGLGARRGDIAKLADHPRDALRDEIDDRDAALLKGDDLLDTADALEAMDDLIERKAAGKATRTYGLPLEMDARLRRIRRAPIGFAERLTSFWANHFAVAARSARTLRFLAGPYEREAIRPHVLGKFGDMLLAATRHPAMLRYLNNVSSIGPSSEAGERRGMGLNENHAREILELHTLGVDGGYKQADVTSFAKILTGWTYSKNKDKEKRYGRFSFVESAHEPGAHEVFGETFQQEGVEQGEAVLEMLATHPATARHIATKLARHFIADTPPEAVVDRLTRRFLSTDGDLQEMAMALIDTDEAWTAPAEKLRSPQEFVWASIRTLDLKPDPEWITEALVTLGQPLMNPPSPAGFADDTKTWLAPDAMTNRLDIAELLARDADSDDDPRDVAELVLGPRLSQHTANAIALAESRTQGLALLLMSPEFQRR